MAVNTPKPTTTQPMKALPGISDQIASINHTIQKIAQTDAPIFITGEQGTEKAFAAKLVHAMSNRANKPLYKVTITNVLPNDFAMRFRQCNDGTLVLNITRRIPADIQIVLMELTRDKSFQDPMSGEMIKADVRFIITTSFNLKELMEAQDLLDDLAKLVSRRSIEIPPLRERPEDIPALVRYATSRARDTGRSNVTEGDAQVLALFRQWHWPGNAEDLLLVTAEACLQSKGDRITLEDLSEEFLDQVGEERLEVARKVRIAITSPKALQMQPATDALVTEANAMLDESPEGEDDLTVNAQRYRRLLMLTRRLQSQSEILTRQMAGPLDGIPGSSMIPNIDPTEEESEELSEQLEGQLDKSLDYIMGLRRQLALLNEREQKTIETARDLYRRLILAGEDTTSMMHDQEVQNETADLADSLREMDEVIQRVSGSFPKLTAQFENKSTATALGREEAEFVAKALRRAHEPDVGEERAARVPKSPVPENEEDITMRDLIRFVTSDDKGSDTHEDTEHDSNEDTHPPPPR